MSESWYKIVRSECTLYLDESTVAATYVCTLFLMMCTFSFLMMYLYSWLIHGGGSNYHSFNMVDVPYVDGKLYVR